MSKINATDQEIVAEMDRLLEVSVFVHQSRKAEVKGLISENISAIISDARERIEAINSRIEQAEARGRKTASFLGEEDLVSALRPILQDMDRSIEKKQIFADYTKLMVEQNLTPLSEEEFYVIKEKPRLGYANPNQPSRHSPRYPDGSYINRDTSHIAQDSAIVNWREFVLKKFAIGQMVRLDDTYNFQDQYEVIYEIVGVNPKMQLKLKAVKVNAKMAPARNRRRQKPPVLSDLIIEVFPQDAMFART